MYDELIIYGLIVLVIIIAIAGGIGFVIRLFLGRAGGKGQKVRETFMDVFISREDVVSQFYFLFSIIFLGLAIHAINRKFSNPLSWQTVVLLTSGAGLAIGYYYKVIYTAFFGALGLSFWWIAKAVDWVIRDEPWIESIIKVENIKSASVLGGVVLLTLIFYLVGRWHEGQKKYKRLALLYSNVGLIFMTGFLFFCSTREGIYMLPEITDGRPFYASWQIALSLVVFLLAFLALSFLLFSRKLATSKELISMGIILLIFFTLLVSAKIETFKTYNSRWDYGGGGLSSVGVFWAIIFNLAVFLEVLGVIFLGYIKRENYLVNLGMFFMFILILVKYFDWFFESLDKGIFFILAGILLFVVGWFMERGRKYLISNMKSEAPIIQN